MENDNEQKIEFVRCNIPKVCICLSCGMEQMSKICEKYIKKAKTLNIDSHKMLILERIRPFCKNPACKRKYVLDLKLKKGDKSISNCIK
jgi:hypothetical protein